jgi:2-dehydro-3-deoxygluconokinase
MNLAQLGVDTSHVLYGGQRIGTYYFEPAAGMRAPKVIYDRANSAYFDLKPGMIPWHEILKDCAYFHVSGITAAISEQAAKATFEALDVADELGVTVCFDINYRKNLWKYEGADPRGTLSHMLSRCDMMFGDAVEFDWLTQHPQPPFTALDSTFQMQMDEYRAWFDELHAAYPRVKSWMMGMRNEISSKHHTLTGLLWTDGELLQAPIMDEFTRSFIGRTIQVLCETKDEESGLLVGRSYADSPDIDGCVMFEGTCPFGEFAEVLIDDAEDGVLYGREANA